MGRQAEAEVKGEGKGDCPRCEYGKCPCILLDIWKSTSSNLGISMFILYDMEGFSPLRVSIR